MRGEWGQQTRKTLEKQLKSDLPFPKSWKKECPGTSVSSHFPAGAGESEGSPALWQGNRPPAARGARAAPQTAVKANGRVRAPHCPKCSLPPMSPPSQGTGPWHLVDQSSIWCVLTSHTAEPNGCSGGRRIAKDPVWHQPGPAPAVFPWPDQATEQGPAHICVLEKGKQGRVRGWGCSVLHKPDSSQEHL